MTETHSDRTEQERDEAQGERDDASAPEADPSTGPGPRGNQEPDPERVQNSEEDLGRAGAN